MKLINKAFQRLAMFCWRRVYKKDVDFAYTLLSEAVSRVEAYEFGQGFCVRTIVALQDPEQAGWQINCLDESFILD